MYITSNLCTYSPILPLKSNFPLHLIPLISFINAFSSACNAGMPLCVAKAAVRRAQSAQDNDLRIGGGRNTADA